MTVDLSEESSNRVQQQGDNSTTDFDFDWLAFQDSDIIVYKVNRSTGVATEQTLDTDYTVSIVAGTQGGTVSYTVAPTTSQDALILPNFALSQTTAFPIESNIPEEKFENGLDKVTMITKQLSERIDRALLLPVSSELTDIAVPTPSAGKALLWNATADGLENSTDDFNDIVTDATTQATAAAASAASASTSASNASTSASNAATSETNAAASAAAAALNVGNFETADVVIKTDNYTLTADDAGKLMLMNSGTAKAFTFPAITGDEVYHVGNIGAGALTLTPNGAETSDVSSLAQNEGVTLIGDLSNTKLRLHNLFLPASYITHAHLSNNVITGATSATIAAGDALLISDADDSGNLKQGTVQGVLDLVSGGASGFVSVRRSSNQSVSPSSDTKIQYNSETFDADGLFDSTTNYRYTCPSDGKYLVITSIGFQGNEDQKRVGAYIFKNGTVYNISENTLSGTTDCTTNITDIVDCSENDYIEGYTNHNMSGAKNTNWPNRTTLVVCKLA